MIATSRTAINNQGRRNGPAPPARTVRRRRRFVAEVRFAGLVDHLFIGRRSDAGRAKRAASSRVLGTRPSAICDAPSVELACITHTGCQVMHAEREWGGSGQVAKDLQGAESHG